MTDQLSLFDGDRSKSTGEDTGEQDRDARMVELTTRQVSLLIEYGYPFAEQEQRLRSSKAVKGIHRVRIGAYWIELMMADLIRSAREISRRRLLDELDELYSALEYALARGRWVPMR
jgi:hypothetical protein